MQCVQPGKEILVTRGEAILRTVWQLLLGFAFGPILCYSSNINLVGSIEIVIKYLNDYFPKKVVKVRKKERKKASSCMSLRSL